MNTHRTPFGFRFVTLSLSCLAALAIFSLVTGGRACADDEAPAQAPPQKHVELFSDRGRVFPPLLADPKEAQFRLGFLGDFHGSAFLDFVFGGDAALARVDYDNGRMCSLTVRGLVSPRFQFNSSSFDLLNTDFQGGLALGTSKGDTACEWYLFHQSSHLGDEVLDSGLREKIDYSKEGLRFLTSRRLGPLRLYGGPTVNFRTDPDEYEETLVLQAGAEYAFMQDTRPMFLALDLRSRQGNDWNVNATAQFAVELGDPKVVKRRHRLFVELFTGYSDMGQYYNESESRVLIGVAYNFL